jgi:hypothetical protein
MTADKLILPYVMVGPRGVAYVGLHESEAAAWWIALGFPDQSEIEAKKAAGFRMWPAELSWKEKP